MPRNGNVAHKLQEAGSQSSREASEQQQLSTDAPVAQNSNRVELLGLSMGQQGQKEGGKGEGRQHPQLGCCVASNFINTFIILCHTASGTSGACTPPPSTLLSLSPSLLPSLPSPSACADGNQSATAGALASHLAPDFWLNVTTAAASPDAF